MATLVCCGVVRAPKRLQVTDDWIGDHDDKGQHPCSCDDTVGMGTSLPHPRLQGITNGTVALNGYGNQAECRDAD